MLHGKAWHLSLGAQEVWHGEGLETKGSQDKPTVHPRRPTGTLLENLVPWSLHTMSSYPAHGCRSSKRLQNYACWERFTAKTEFGGHIQSSRECLQVQNQHATICSNVEGGIEWGHLAVATIYESIASQRWAEDYQQRAQEWSSEMILIFPTHVISRPLLHDDDRNSKLPQVEHHILLIKFLCGARETIVVSGEISIPSQSAFITLSNCVVYLSPITVLFSLQIDPKALLMRCYLPQSRDQYSFFSGKKVRAASRRSPAWRAASREFRAASETAFDNLAKTAKSASLEAGKRCSSNEVTASPGLQCHIRWTDHCFSLQWPNEMDII